MTFLIIYRIIEEVNFVNILFVLDSLSTSCGANVNIAITIKQQLEIRGCNVIALSKYDFKRPPDKKTVDKFKKVYFLDSDVFEMFEINQSSTNDNYKYFSAFKWNLHHPGVLLKTIDIVLLNSFFTKREFAKKIKYICDLENIDAIVAFASPYYLAEAVAISKVDIIKSVFQLDPYTNNYTLIKCLKPLRKKIEMRVLDKLDILFATNFVKDDLKNELQSENLIKVIEANIPGIIVSKMQELVNCNSSSNGEIICFFAGKFYKDIRNPEFLLKIFVSLPHNFILHIAGTGCEEVLHKYQSILGSRLVLHGYLPKEKINTLINKSDILVNVDNTIKNQMPSKIVEYICTGRKILNICKSEDYLSSKLLENYSNGISIYENLYDIGEIVALVKEFSEKKSHMISSCDILDNYREYTDVFVSELIFNSLKNINM